VHKRLTFGQYTYCPPHTQCGGHIGFARILSFYGSQPRFQLEDGSDQTAQWIDFKFADNVDHTPNLGLKAANFRDFKDFDDFEAVFHHIFTGS
jgi:hypothetical protein